MRGVFGVTLKSFAADSIIIVANGKWSINVVDIFRIVWLKLIMLLGFIPFANLLDLMIIRIRTSSK